MMMKHLPLSHAGQLIEFHSAMLHPKLANAVQAHGHVGHVFHMGGNSKFIRLLQDVLETW